MEWVSERQRARESREDECEKKRLDETNGARTLEPYADINNREDYPPGLSPISQYKTGVPRRIYRKRQTRQQKNQATLPVVAVVSLCTSRPLKDSFAAWQSIYNKPGSFAMSFAGSIRTGDGMEPYVPKRVIFLVYSFIHSISISNTRERESTCVRRKKGAIIGRAPQATVILCKKIQRTHKHTTTTYRRYQLGLFRAFHTSLA